MLNFKEDGTFSADFDRTEDGENRETRVVETVTVGCRRPTLEELFQLWEAYDSRGGDTEEDLDDVDDDGKPKLTAVEKRGKTFDQMRRNAAWYNDAFHKLGDRSIEDLAQPVWFGFGAAAASMIQHWQDVPLAPGVERKIKALTGS